jgi:hypothetical protein
MPVDKFYANLAFWPVLENAIASTSLWATLEELLGDFPVLLVSHFKKD